MSPFLSSGRRVFRVSVRVLSFLLTAAVLGTTVYERLIRCPICRTKSKVALVGSWGSYACGPEGELDLVSCPIAYTGELWSCRKCRFTASGTNVQVPREKVAAIRRFLDRLPSDVQVSRPSVDDQLLIEEGIYRILGRDRVFWSEFYRVAGFFAALEGKHQRATGLRASALRVTEELIADPARAAYRKEDLLVAGAMAAKLGEKDRARKYLLAVEAARYDPPTEDASRVARTRNHMDELAGRILKSLE